MSLNAVILICFTVWVLSPGGAMTGNVPDSARPGVTSAKPSYAPEPVITKAWAMAQPGTRFGLSAPQVPYSSKELDELSTLAGARPSVLQHFLKWNQELRKDALAITTEREALPVVSWEPWDGVKAGVNQPKYSLARIYGGAYDDYITRAAMTIKEHKHAVAIRFAHEMNGPWYPWSERRSGNKPGDYVKAYRHVHDLFARLGVTNVIWIWSPNIIRPVPGVSLEGLYPGDDYVDWVGVVGYAVRESTAGQVFDPTIERLRSFTDKKIIITETGVQPGPNKVDWIKDFFSWLADHPDVVGFIWFEFSVEQGGSSDWRFSSTPETAEAFRAGLAGIDLAPPVRA